MRLLFFSIDLVENSFILIMRGSISPRAPALRVIFLVLILVAETNLQLLSFLPFLLFMIYVGQCLLTAVYVLELPRQLRLLHFYELENGGDILRNFVCEVWEIFAMKFRIVLHSL